MGASNSAENKGWEKSLGLILACAARERSDSDVDRLPEFMSRLILSREGAFRPGTAGGRRRGGSRVISGRGAFFYFFTSASFQIVREETSSKWNGMGVKESKG